LVKRNYLLTFATQPYILQIINKRCANGSGKKSVEETFAKYRCQSAEFCSQQMANGDESADWGPRQWDAWAELWEKNCWD